MRIQSLLLRALIGAAVVAAAGCAEHNFVPGSPMAHLMGYHRTYEQIAADDCSRQFKLEGAAHAQCVASLSASRRQSDAAYMQAVGALAGAASAGRDSRRSYVLDGRPVNCRTVATTPGVATTSCY